MADGRRLTASGAGWSGERNPLVQLTLARFREFSRQPETVFWVFAFPILLAIALGIAFRNRPPDKVRIAIEAGAGADSLAARLAGARDLRVEVLDSATAAARLRTGRVALVVVPGDPVVYRFDSTRTESHLARLVTDDEVQRAYGRRDVRAVREVKITEQGARYIDFLLPGLLGMNLMGTGLWGVGFAVVSMRVRKLLKRLLASPMRRSHLLLSFAFARLVTVAFEVAVLVGFGMLVFGNLRGRTDQNLAVAETFSYDPVDRLEGATSSQLGTLDLRYDAAGNLTYKTGHGAYQYPAPGSPRPHAVLASGDGRRFTYDANGNLLSDRAGRELVWSARNELLAVGMWDGYGSYELLGYGPEGELLSRLEVDTSPTGSSSYVVQLGQLYELATDLRTGRVERRHMIYADGALVAEYTTASQGAQPARATCTATTSSRPTR